MRLDGYFEEYKLAIEYDGIQHYEYMQKFDKKYDDFIKRQERDRIKDKLCKENRIKLIRIRYDEPLTEEYLKQKLIKEGIIKED
jgi:very-short-patch-repair endonuclease